MTTALVIAEPEPGPLERQLLGEGFQVHVGPEPLPLVDALRPDLVLLGDEAVLEEWTPTVPTIVLGRARSDALDRVRALRRGCDDYVDRPFHVEELVERIRAVLRRTAPEPLPEVVEAGPVVIDRRTRRVRLHERRVCLAQKEYELLLALAVEPDRVFEKEELLRSVWGYRSIGRTRTLDSHASRLRRKLRVADPESQLVDNVWGVGYRLLPD